MTDKLGDRMKQYYEGAYRIMLPRRLPLIIRIDGCHFHTFTKGFEKPHDEIMHNCMSDMAKYVAENIQGCKLAFVQSDEASFLITDYDDIKTDAWFDKNLQKIVSVSASLATIAFNKSYMEYVLTHDKFRDEKFQIRCYSATFDSRAFVLPKEEVINYFIWRQNDATRNAIQGLGQANFSHKEIQHVNTSVMQEKLFTEKGINFNNEPAWFRHGWCLVKQAIDHTINNNTFTRHIWTETDPPIFTADRSFVELYV